MSSWLQGTGEEKFAQLPCFSSRGGKGGGTAEDNLEGVEGGSVAGRILTSEEMEERRSWFHIVTRCCFRDILGAEKKLVGDARKKHRQKGQ